MKQMSTLRHPNALFVASILVSGVPWGIAFAQQEPLPPEPPQQPRVELVEPVMVIDQEPATDFQPPMLPSQQRGGTPSERFQSLLKDLGDVDLLKREEADRSMASDPGIALSMIEEALTRSTLSPEQRSRLEKLGTERFALTPRAALGVTFDSRGTFYTDGVSILGTTEGFDAHRALQTGDVIHSMSGTRVMSFEDARRVISSHDPGERMTLQILRNNEPLLVRVTLGNYEDLMRRDFGGRGGSGRTRAVLEDAWKLRLERRGLLHRAPINADGGLTFRDLQILEAEIESASASRTKGAGSPDAADSELSTAVARAGGNGVVDLAAVTDFSKTGGDPALSELQEEQRRVMSHMNELQSQLRNAQGLPEFRRNAIGQQILQLRQRQAELQSKILSLEANRPKRTGNGFVVP
jgi:hypothetical protein